MYVKYPSVQMLAQKILRAMNNIDVRGFSNPRHYKDVESCSAALSEMSGTVKHIMCIAYGMSHYTMLDAIDGIKKHPCYRRSMRYFSLCLKDYKDNCRNLLYTDTNRFFHVADMSESLRSMYRKDLTDREYFDYWIDCGASAHSVYGKELQVLYYKIVKCLSSKGVEYPETVAWCVLEKIALEEAVSMYEKGVVCGLGREYGFKSSVIRAIFGIFDLSSVDASWQRACVSLYPDFVSLADVILSDHNIQLGMHQYVQSLERSILTFDSVKEAIEDNECIWSGKESFKKAKRFVNKWQKCVNEKVEDVV